MNRKTLVSLLIIAVLALYLVVANNQDGGEAVDLPVWDDGLDEIVIRRQDPMIKLYRENGAWVINDEKYPADPGQVAAMEKKLKEMRVTDLISEKEHYRVYELEPDEALHVIARKDGKTVRDFYVGKKSPTYQQTYIRLSGREGIYLAPGTLDTDFGKTVDGLRDKEILKISKNAIESMDLTYKGKTLTFKKKKVEKEQTESGDAEEKDSDKGDDVKKVQEDRWICEQYPGRELDKNQVTQLATAFDPLRAKSFADMKKNQVSGLMSRVVVHAYDKKITVTVHREFGDNTYLATSSESKYPFILDAFRAKKLFKTIGDLEKQ